MRPRIVAIRIDPVRGGSEVSLMAQGGRGIRYRYKSVVVRSEGLAPKAFRTDRAAAIEELIANLDK